MSNYQHLYKNAGQVEEKQSIRRERLLEIQRDKRNSALDKARNITIFAEKNQNYKKNNSYYDYNYRNKLMLSEWMSDGAPEDIEDFYLVPVPKGTRCLIVSENNHKPTKVFYKNGRLFKKFNSNLPSNTILDCIYNETTRTFYILDLLVYGNRDMMNCDSQFRFFWLKSKFIEDNIKVIDSDLTLALLSYHDFVDSTLINVCLQSHPLWENDEPNLDGYLFYHKEASYMSGTTPLVLWLFPFMMEEVFPYQLNSIYNTQTPDDYTNYKDFIRIFEETRQRKATRKGKASITDDKEMEQSDDEVECPMKELELDMTE